VLIIGLSFGNPLCLLGQLYVVVLFARAILSWFPIHSDSPLLPVVRFTHLLTEPLLAPLRRVIPPAGMFDISFLVAIFAMQLVIVPLLCRL
jgi:YggT family protein